MTVYKLTRGDQKGLGETLFPLMPPGITRNNGHKLLESRFRLDIRKNYFTVRVARIWEQLPREVVLGTLGTLLKKRLDAYLAGII